jgi:predicted metalloprotease with PDZ domain
VKFATMRKTTILVFLFLFITMTELSGQTVDYSIRIPDPKNHYAQVSMNYTAQEKGLVKVSMPVWTPGSYLVREFAKNIETVTIEINGKSINVSKSDKNTWSFPAKKGDKIFFQYNVYCYEMSVRTSYIDEDQALLNLASVCAFIEGKEKTNIHCMVELPGPWNDFVSHVDLISADRTKGAPLEVLLTFENFDEMVDSPIQLGNFETFNFNVNNVPHRVAMVGIHNANIEKLKVDMQNICQTMVNIIDEMPCKTYTFIIQNVEAGGGGLEHKNGSTLMMSRFNYTNAQSYQGLLGLIAHEYFHLWNVKRIRPVALGPFDYNNENYTKSLWIAEGITSYFDELALMRAGYISKQDFLNTLTGYINNHENRAGSKIATLHELSWDAWIKEYRPNENSKNNSYSYYSKGLIIGALLDMTICKSTNGKKSLDDVFKTLYKDFYLNNKKSKDGIGYTDEDFLNVCNKVAGVELNADFNIWLTTTISPDYVGIFNNLDIQSKKQEINRNSWGLNYETSNGKTIVKYVRNPGPSNLLGINVNDELIALNGVRLNNDLEQVWNKLGKPSKVSLTISRSGLMREISGNFKGLQEVEYTFLLGEKQMNKEFWSQTGALQKWLISK